MRKSVIAMLCTTSLLLQGCWTTQSKDNPQYADCSSYHDRGYEMKQEANYVTVVSASVGRCYGAEGAKIPQARVSAMDKCKSSNNQDCAVFAENKKFVLSPTIKNRDVDWDGTFTLLTLGMAGAVAYEAGQSGAVYTPPAYVPPSATYTSNSSVGRLPVTPAMGAVIPSPSSHQSNANSNGTRAPAVNHCLSLRDGDLHNNCPFTVNATWCVAPGGSACKLDSSWNIASGKSYPVVGSGRGRVNWLACRGRDTVRYGNGQAVGCDAE